MAKLKFDQLADRTFETGVAEGVVFVGTPTATTKGVAWNGLTQVTVSPEGGDANDQYADNIKYLSLRGAENTNGSVEALTVPPELFECMGKTSIVEGIDAYFAQQTKVPFSFAYKTKVGNGEKGVDYSEKIHIIYNATLDPVESSSSTINESPEAPAMTFAFNTVPLAVEGYKPTAHFEIKKPADTNTAGLAKYNAIKDMIYGTDGEGATDSVLPMPEKLLEILKAQG